MMDLKNGVVSKRKLPKSKRLALQASRTGDKIIL